MNSGLNPMQCVALASFMLLFIAVVVITVNRARGRKE